MSGAEDWGYRPENTIARQAEFVEELAQIVGMDWSNANVWSRHDELKARIQTLAQTAGNGARAAKPELPNVHSAAGDRTARNGSK